MQHLAILLIGFSLFYGVIFLLTHFKDQFFNDQKLSHFFGIILILALMALQVVHYLYFSIGHRFLFSHSYLILLYLVAPSFYFYSRSLLKAEDHFKPIHLLHFVPLPTIFLLPQRLAFMLAFLVGCGYLLWLLKAISALKQHKDQFKSEILLLSVVFVVAVAVSVIVLFMPLEQPLFYAFYSCAIGIALLMVALVISSKPEISEEVGEIARETYAVSTLTNIDAQAKLTQLQDLMSQQKIYQQSNLDRHTLATELDLNSHQLSELMNTKLQKGFSNYLREQRVDAAKKLLIEQPKISVLSVGLEVGFASQSNFYEAFKEMTGTTPAKYRKQAIE